MKTPQPKKVSDEEVLKAKERLDRGETLREVAPGLGISYVALSKRVKRLTKVNNKAEKVNNRVNTPLIRKLVSLLGDVDVPDDYFTEEEIEAMREVTKDG